MTAAQEQIEENLAIFAAQLHRIVGPAQPVEFTASVILYRGEMRFKYVCGYDGLTNSSADNAVEALVEFQDKHEAKSKRVQRQPVPLPLALLEDNSNV